MEQITPFANKMVDQLCIGKFEYINRTKIVQDITTKLETFQKEFKDYGYDFVEEDDDDRFDFINTKAYEFQKILFVIQDDYIDGGRCLDPRVNEHDLEVMGFLEDFLRNMIKNE